MKARAKQIDRAGSMIGVRQKRTTDRHRHVLVEEIEHTAPSQSFTEAVARAQAMSRQLLAGKEKVTVDDFLAERREAAVLE